MKSMIVGIRVTPAVITDAAAILKIYEKQL
jgi:hypothetical protein